MRDEKKVEDLGLGNEETVLRRQPQHVQNNHCGSVFPGCGADCNYSVTQEL